MEEDLKEAVQLLEKVSAFIDVMKFNLGEDIDQSNLEKQINEFLEKIREKS